MGTGILPLEPPRCVEPLVTLTSLIGQVAEKARLWEM